MNSPDDRLPPAFSASTPVVLRILPKAGSSAPLGISMTPIPLATRGRGGYLTLLPPSLPTKAMRFSGIFAQTSRRTAGLGGSRPPSLTWTAFRTTSSPRVSIFWSPCAPLPTGTLLVCLLWRSTSPLPLIHQFLHVIRSPSPPLDMGGLGGPSTPLPRRLSWLSRSQCAVRILWGGVLNLTPSLKDTSPHALAGPGLLLHMGGALTLVAVSPLPPSRPLLVLGGIIPGML
jgi:hypothetical protein